jgi:hypothetical protein
VRTNLASNPPTEIRHIPAGYKHGREVLLPEPLCCWRHRRAGENQHR